METRFLPELSHMERSVVKQLTPIFPQLSTDVIEKSVRHPSNQGTPCIFQTLIQRCIDDLLELRTFKTDDTSSWRTPQPEFDDTEYNPVVFIDSEDDDEICKSVSQMEKADSQQPWDISPNQNAFLLHPFNQNTNSSDSSTMSHSNNDNFYFAKYANRSLLIAEDSDDDIHDILRSDTESNSSQSSANFLNSMDSVREKYFNENENCSVKSDFKADQQKEAVGISTKCSDYSNELPKVFTPALKEAISSSSSENLIVSSDCNNAKQKDTFGISSKCNDDSDELPVLSLPTSKKSVSSLRKKHRTFKLPVPRSEQLKDTKKSDYDDNIENIQDKSDTSSILWNSEARNNLPDADVYDPSVKLTVKCDNSRKTWLCKKETVDNIKENIKMPSCEKRIESVSTMSAAPAVTSTGTSVSESYIMPSKFVTTPASVFSFDMKTEQENKSHTFTSDTHSSDSETATNGFINTPSINSRVPTFQKDLSASDTISTCTSSQPMDLPASDTSSTCTNSQPRCNVVTMEPTIDPVVSGLNTRLANASATVTSGALLDDIFKNVATAASTNVIAPAKFTIPMPTQPVMRSTSTTQTVSSADVQKKTGMKRYLHHHIHHHEHKYNPPYTPAGIPTWQDANQMPINSQNNTHTFAPMIVPLHSDLLPTVTNTYGSNEATAVVGHVKYNKNTSPTASLHSSTASEINTPIYTPGPNHTTNLHSHNLGPTGLNISVRNSRPYLESDVMTDFSDGRSTTLTGFRRDPRSGTAPLATGSRIVTINTINQLPVVELPSGDLSETMNTVGSTRSEAVQPVPSASNTVIVVSSSKSHSVPPVPQSSPNRLQTDPILIPDFDLDHMANTAQMKLQQSLDLVVAMFPDIDPIAAMRLIEADHSPNAVNNICNFFLESATYPKKNKPTQTSTVSDQPDTREKMIDYFNNFKDFVDSKYREDTIIYLGTQFEWIYTKDLRRISKIFNYHYAPAYRAMSQIMRVVKEKGKIDSKFQFSGAVVNTSLEPAIEYIPTLEVQLMRCPRSSRPGLSDLHPHLCKEIEFVTEKMMQIEEEKDRVIAQKYNEKEYEDNGQLITCGCCYGDYPFEDMVQCAEGHLFCQECLKRYAQEAVFGSGKASLSCMTTECDSLFPLSQLRRALPSTTLTKYEDRVQEENINLADLVDLVRCPHCDFAALMDPGDKVFKCQNTSCEKETCRYCKQDWVEHFGKRCEEIEKKDETNLRLEFEEKMTTAKIRTCHKCKTKFTKLDGCNKMTCRCGARMCYACRKPTIDYKHFCQHVRDPGKPCNVCDSCFLWSNPEEDDERAIKEIQKEATEVRKQQGYEEEKLIGAPSEGPPIKKHKK